MANPIENVEVPEGLTLVGYLCFDDLWPNSKWPEDAEYVKVDELGLDHVYTRVYPVMVPLNTPVKERDAILPTDLERLEASDEFWIRKSGVRVPVGEMNEHHVRNALRFIIRRARSTAGLPKWLLKCLEDATQKTEQDGSEDNDLREPE